MEVRKLLSDVFDFSMIGSWETSACWLVLMARCRL